MPVVLERYCAGKHSEEEIQALINEAMGDFSKRTEGLHRLFYVVVGQKRVINGPGHVTSD